MFCSNKGILNTNENKISKKCYRKLLTIKSPNKEISHQAYIVGCFPTLTEYVYENYYYIQWNYVSKKK